MWFRRDGTNRLNPILNLFRYDQRRLLGLLAALRSDPLAVVAGVSVTGVFALGAAWVVATRSPNLSVGAAAAAGLVGGAGLARSLDPLSGLRAGPLGELADDRVAVPVWLCARALTVLALALLTVSLEASRMGWRPDETFLTAVAAAGVGIVLAVAGGLSPLRPPSRKPSPWRPPSGPSPRLRNRAARLGWIDLTRRESGLPAGVWAAGCWVGSLLIGLAGTEPRLAMVADGAAAVLAFLAAVLTLRFDAATARLLTFEPTSFFRLAVDVLGARLVVVLAAGALIALVAAPAVLAGVALGAGLRTLEFLHGVRRSASAARLLAQVETALVMAIALVAGPAALIWLVARSAWLYRRNTRSMGLA